MKPANMILPILCSVPALFGCSSTWDKVTRSDQITPIKPSFSTGHSKQTASDYYQIGRYYQGQNRLDKAEDAFRKALEIQVDNVETKNALGTVYSKQGKFAEAIEVFTAILKTKPDIAKVYNNLAYTHFLQGKHTEAIATFEKALKLEPQNPRTWNNLGLALHKIGDEEQARIAFSRAADLSVTIKPYAAPNTQLANSAINAKMLTAAVSHDSPKVIELQSDAVRITSLTPHIRDLGANGIAPHHIKPTALSSDLVKSEPILIAVATLAPSAVNEPDASLSPAHAPESHAEKRMRTLTKRPSDREEHPAGNAAILSAVSQPIRSGGKINSTDQPAPTVKVTSEARKFHLEIANGNGVTGMAKRTGVVLVQKGLPAPRLSNIKPYLQAQTVIYYRDGHREHALQLSQKLAVTLPLALNNHMPRHTDVKLVLGKDIVNQTTLSRSIIRSSPLVFNTLHQGFEG